MSNASFAPPVLATSGATDPSAPPVVLLHGRGSCEQEIVGLAAHLPAGLAYVAVRAPIAKGGGYAWFAKRGIGRPVADSLRSAMGCFRSWLDEAAAPDRPMVLVGFSGGAAFAGGLVLDDPTRYAGAAILYGTLPFEAGVPTDAGRLANLPMFVAQGDGDHVIPRELLDRTLAYLLSESGAPTVAHRQPGGHQLTAETVHQLADWLADRLAYVTPTAQPQPDHPATSPGPHSLATGSRNAAALGLRFPGPSPNCTVITTLVMGAAPVERSVTAAAYSFVRFSGGAVAPYAAGKLGEHISVHAPFWMAFAVVAVGVVVLATFRRTVLVNPPTGPEQEAEAVLVGDAD